MASSTLSAGITAARSTMVRSGFVTGSLRRTVVCPGTRSRERCTTVRFGCGARLRGTVISTMSIGRVDESPDPSRRPVRSHGTRSRRQAGGEDGPLPGFGRAGEGEDPRMFLDVPSIPGTPVDGCPRQSAGGRLCQGEEPVLPSAARSSNVSSPAIVGSLRSFGQESCRFPRRFLPRTLASGEEQGQGTLPRMGSQLNLRGVYVAAVTPFGPDGAVALDALEGLVHGFSTPAPPASWRSGRRPRPPRWRRTRSRPSSTCAPRSAPSARPS